MIIFEQDKRSIRSKSKPASRRPARFRRPLPIFRLSARRVGGVFLAIAGLGIITVAIINISQFTNSGSDEKPAASNVEMTEFKDVYLTRSDEQNGDAAQASVVAPKSWLREQKQYGPSELLNPADYGILNVQFSNKQSGDSTKRKGQLLVENVEGWLAAGESNPESAFGGIATQAGKQQMYSVLMDLRESKTVNNLDWRKLFPAKTEIGGIQKPSYINTADGKLSGIIYATIVSPDNSYRPQIMAYLAGSVAGKPVLLRAQFAVENQTYQELYGSISPGAEAAQRAIDDYKAGNLDADDTAMLGHVVSLVKSFTLDTPYTNL